MPFIGFSIRCVHRILEESEKSQNQNQDQDLDQNLQHKVGFTKSLLSLTTQLLPGCSQITISRIIDLYLNSKFLSQNCPETVADFYFNLENLPKVPKHRLKKLRTKVSKLFDQGKLDLIKRLVDNGI